MNSPVCFPCNVPAISAHTQFDVADDAHPRSHKRRRISGPAATGLALTTTLLRRRVSQYSSVSDLSVDYLPPATSSDNVVGAPVRARSYDSTTRHAPPAMDPVLLGGIYNYEPDTKLASQQYDRGSSPMSDGAGYGPFLGQYWNFVQGSIAHAGVPLSQNGNYVSPYCAPTDQYFPAAHVNALSTAPEMHQGGIVTIGGVSTVEDANFAGHTVSGYETVAAHRDANMYSPQGDGNPWQYPAPDPTLHLQSIQLLDSLSNQILRDVISTTAQDFLAVATAPNSPRGQAHATLQALFEQNKKVFSRDNLFIELSIRGPYNNPTYARTFRKANLAAFVSCVFRGCDVPFLDLDDNFLDIFMPSGSRLLKHEGALFLELKTQAYIAIMLNNKAATEEVLDKLFPRDLQLSILRRRAEPTHLAPSEQDFISRLNSRRQYLAGGSHSIESLRRLPQQYIWKDFLEEVVVCIRRALEAMDALKDLRAVDTAPFSTPMTEDHHPKATIAGEASGLGRQPSHNGAFGVSNTDPRRHSPSRGPPSFVGSKRTPSGSPVVPAAQRSAAPMMVQYEHARATTHPKTPPFNRRTGAPSQRRPWSQEEEKALMDGLDHVKGPHWSQILALFGPGGSISEVLKDRNQVQLKDKARNLKLFFLKSGIEVPVYLQRVTGELKTRAPAQAAKREAKERLKALEEERARLGLQPGEPLPSDREREILQQRPTRT